MVVIYMFAGMGNQMFQYALYKSLKAKGRRVYIYDRNTSEHRKREEVLSKYFNVQYKKYFPLISKSRDYLRTSNIQYLTKIVKFLESIIRKRIIDNNCFNEEVLNVKKATLFGYWQSEKYFNDPEVQKQLRKDFTPLDTIEFSNEFKKLKEEIKKTNSVSIHIRRTDYLSDINNRNKYVGICTPTYYERAIKYICEREKDLTFYVFSDDKKYVKETYKDKDNYVLVNLDNNLTDLEEFLLMKQCKHHIMAHSSFSWWAAWLNDDPESINLAPDRWQNYIDNQDIYTDRMIKIKSGE